jgi:hypothetical protein
MRWLGWIAFGLVSVVGPAVFSVLHERQFEKEYEKNERHDPPEALQLKWHVRHIREDIALLCKYVWILIMLEVWRMVYSVLEKM